MIDSGASSSIMPKSIADQLGLKYEPMIKHVLQLDDTSVVTVGIVKDLKMALHECPGCLVIQDISIVELPPHFAIYLSRDFTSQLGGYIASNWSYLFFRTRYGTKASIRSEPLALCHIEPYIPSPVNVNYTAQDEKQDISEHDTSLVNIPDYLLDEWATVD